MPPCQIIKTVVIVIFAKLMAVFTLIALSRTHFEPDALFAYVHFQTLLIVILLLRKAKIDFVPSTISPFLTMRNNVFVFFVGAAFFGIALRMAYDGFVALDTIIFKGLSVQDITHEFLQLWHSSRAISFIKLAEAISGAIEEEIVYRFMIFSVIERAYGMRFAVVISASIFAVMHFDPYMFITGAALSLVYLYRRNIVLPIIAHTIGNLWHAIIASLGVGDLSVDQSIIVFSGHFALTFLFMMSFVILIFMAMVSSHKWLSAQSEISKLKSFIK